MLKNGVRVTYHRPFDGPSCVRSEAQYQHDSAGQDSATLPRTPQASELSCHQQREEIESAFIAWRSPAVIAEEYGLADRASVYRHAHALGLFQKRQRHVGAALERIIEKAGEVDVQLPPWSQPCAPSQNQRCW